MKFREELSTDFHLYFCKSKIHIRYFISDSSTEPPAPACPEGVHQYGKACFAVRPLKLRVGDATWNAARMECTTVHADPSMSTDIATITDVYENAFIRILVDTAAKDHQIGEATAWIGMMEINGNYQWHNSCPATFTSLGSLIGTPEKNYCLYIEDGKWWPTQCENTEISHVVCEYRQSKCIFLKFILCCNSCAVFKLSVLGLQLHVPL